MLEKNELPKIVVILGPTAVGKTALSLELAQKYNGEIISGDSMQIYRGLSIGTAKATSAEQKIAPHHLIDIADPTEIFSAAKFVALAQTAIKEITAKNKLPIIVGGTGFYIQALLGDRPLANLDIDLPEAEVAAWTKKVQQEGESGIRAALATVDPVSEARILPGQIRRLVRALLISQHSGQAFSALQPVAQRQYNAFIIGLNTDRQKLYDRINQRVDLMLENGLLAEAQLVEKLPVSSTAKMAIGYKELFPYLSGESSLTQASEQLKLASRRYAKRQLTWFNNQFTDIHWYDLVEHPSELNEIIDELARFV